MNVFNVHSNRVSVDGKVEKLEYFPGKFVNADLDKASVENERNAIVIRRAQDGQVVTLVQVAGLVARRILCYTRWATRSRAASATASSASARAWTCTCPSMPARA